MAWERLGLVQAPQEGERCRGRYRSVLDSQGQPLMDPLGRGGNQEGWLGGLYWGL